MWAPFHDLRKYEETPLLVIKKDGRRELFDSQKLTNGLLKAFEKDLSPMNRSSPSRLVLNGT